MVIVVSMWLSWSGCEPGERPRGSLAVAAAGPAARARDVVVDGGVEVCEPPEGQHGISVGRVMPPLTLTACDGSTYDFHGDAFCDARATLLVLATAWCGPAIAQAVELESAFVAAYADRGLRVIQVLVQTEDYTAPDERDCADWVARSGLTDVTLIDPDAETAILTPGNVSPVALVVDSGGVIRHRAHGWGAEVRAEIDAVLEAVLDG